MRDKRILVRWYVIVMMVLGGSSLLLATTVLESIENALTHTQKLKVQAFEVEIQQKYEEQAKSNYYPRIDFNLYKKEEKIEFQSSESEIYSSTNYSLSLTQNLYNGNFDEYMIKMFGKDVEFNLLEYEHIEQNVIYEALSSHLSLFLATTLMKTQKSLLNDYQALIKIANTKGKYGDENEQIALQSSFYNAKIKYLHLKEDYAFKRFKYIQIVGKEPSNLGLGLKIKKGLVASAQEVNLRETNHNLRQNTLKREKAELQIERDKSLFLPKLDLELKAYKVEPLAQLSTITENQYSAKINLSYNFYNGGRDKLEKEINQLKKLKLMAQGDDLNEDIGLKYSDSLNKYHYTLKNIQTINRYIINETNKYDKYKKIFKLSGNKSLMDILTALNNLYSAKELKTTNQYGQMMNYVNLLLLQSKLTLENLQ